MIKKEQVEESIVTGDSIKVKKLGKKHFVSFERDSDFSHNQRLRVTMRDNRSKVTHQNIFMLSEEKVKEDEIKVIHSTVNHFLGNLNQYRK